MNNNTRNCPKCGKPIVYTRISSRNYAEKLGKLCNSCCHSGERNGSYGKFVTPPYRWLYDKMLLNAKRKNNVVELTFQEFLDDFVSQTKCHYCGDDIHWTPREKRHNKMENYRYHLDRMDSSGPYSVANCVVSCKRCNELKSNKISYELMRGIGELLRSYAQIERMSQC